MKTRFILPLIAFAVLVAVFSIGIKRAPEKSVLASVLIGKPAPVFDLPSLTDPARRVSSKTLLGKPWLLNVWATWCGACREEHSSLLQIQQEGQVSIIGLNWKDEDAAALGWLGELGNPYTQIAVDKRGHAAIDWGVYGAPETFLVDAKGVVIYKHVGALSAEVWQREFLPRLTGRAPGST
jgi:cytochrome c biogenesis protein CcmG/thiol:disulfide interchange protein DsbE